MKEDTGNVSRGDEVGSQPLIPEQILDFFAICPDLLVILDPQSHFVFANSTVCELLVGQPTLPASSRLAEFVAEEDVPKFTAAMAELFDQSGTTRFRTRLHGQAGDALVEWSAGVGTQRRELFAVGRDLTEQRRIASALNLAEKRAQALFENAAQGIVAVDGEGLIQMANSTIEKLFGYAEEELIGERVEKLIPHRFHEKHVEERKEFHASPRNRPMGRGLDLAARHKDGREFPVEISLSHIPAKNEVWSVAFVSDITDRVRARSEAEALQNRLGQAAKMEAVGRLAGGIAHDFNNLLTALTGFSEIVLDYVDSNHPLHEGARQAHETCQRSAGLIRQLLAVSRRQILRPTRVDLNAKLTELEKMLRGLLQEDVQMILELEPAVGAIRVDESQLEQVILNLVVNARDAMPRGGEIRVSTSISTLQKPSPKNGARHESNVAAVLMVSDTGVGIDEDTLNLIFDPFFTTKGESGTGLGLATVYGIVRQSRGQIQVESTPGEGACFRILFPSADAGGLSDSPEETFEPAQGGTETILLVEDESAVRLVAAHALRKAGFTVLEASSGAEALDTARSYPKDIDLLFTDVVMPSMNGPELKTRIARIRPGLRVLFASGHANDELMSRGIDDSIQFLEKPYNSASLVNKVRETLDSAPNEP